MRWMNLIVLTAVALAATPAHAEWKGKGELGGVLARGNTNTETLSGKVDMTLETGKWKHLAGFSILRTVNDSVTSANRWELHGESDYQLSDRSFVFGSGRYENDHFTAFSYQASAAVGYGYKFIDEKDTRLAVKLGAGYRRSELRDSGVVDNNAIVSGMVDYFHRLTDTTSLTNKLLVESGRSNTFLQNALGLQVKINSSLALGLSYDVRHNTTVVAGTKKTDQVLTVNLVFGF